jgi:hypothetical protein
MDLAASPPLGPPRRWPWLTVGMAIVVVLAVGWLVRFGNHAAPAKRSNAATAARPDGWVPYHAEDRSFTVVGPPSPSVQTQTTDLGTQHAIRFTAPSGEILAVETVDLFPSVAGTSSERELVSAWSNRLLGQLNGVIDEQDILRAGSHPGVALTIDDGDRRILVRVFASGTHLYEVAGVVPAAAPPGDMKDATAFVDSFALTS